MITIERYRKSRFWAVYDAGELVCVTVYKKGANAVKDRVERSRVPVPQTLKSERAALEN